MDKLKRGRTFGLFDSHGGGGSSNGGGGRERGNGGVATVGSAPASPSGGAFRNPPSSSTASKIDSKVELQKFFNDMIVMLHICV